MSSAFALKYSNAGSHLCLLIGDNDLPAERWLAVYVSATEFDKECLENLSSLQLTLSQHGQSNHQQQCILYFPSHPFSCSAGGNGGGLALAANGATWTTITSSNLSYNQAALDGGAFNVTGGATVLANNSFIGNHVDGRGGAISYAHECFTPSENLWRPKSIDLESMDLGLDFHGVCVCWLGLACAYL